MGNIAKRTFDIVLSLVGIILLFPLFVVIGILIKREDRGPILFRQERVGQGFKIFRLYKFRTMTVHTGCPGPLITTVDDPRITRIGSVLRRYKLDELPQLFNVLMGDMSLVGPRPELLQYVQVYNEIYERILTVKPGITDYAALVFRNEEAILSDCRDVSSTYLQSVLPAKIKLYEIYIEDHSIRSDIWIILKTITSVLRNSS